VRLTVSAGETIIETSVLWPNSHTLLRILVYPTHDGDPQKILRMVEKVRSFCCRMAWSKGREEL
jgi:hypothetical protein